MRGWCLLVEGWAQWYGTLCVVVVNGHHHVNACRLIFSSYRLCCVKSLRHVVGCACSCDSVRCRGDWRCCSGLCQRRQWYVMVVCEFSVREVFLEWPWVVKTCDLVMWNLLTYHANPGCNNSCKKWKNRRVNHVLQPKLQFYVGISSIITWIKYLGEYHALDRGILLFSSVSLPRFATQVARIVAQNTVDLQLCNHTNHVIFRSPQHVPNTRETHRVLNSRHLSHSHYSRPIRRNWRIHQSSKNRSFIINGINTIFNGLQIASLRHSNAE